MRFRLFKSKSIFISWLATYFLLLLMPVLISTVVYFEAYRIVREDMVSENRGALKQAKTAIDSGMQDIGKFCAFVAFNQNLNLLMQEKDLNSINSHYYQVNNTLNELKPYKFQNEYVQDFYVYFRQVDSVLTTNGFYDSRYFFDHYQRGTIYRNVMTYVEWEKMMNSGYLSAFRSFAPQSNGTGGGKKMVVLMKTLPIYGDSKPSATLVITLDSQSIHDAMGSINPSDDSWGVIVDQNDNVLFSTTPAGYAFPVHYVDMKEDTDLIYTKVNGLDVAVSYTASEAEDWKYVSVIPLSAFQARVSYIRTLIVAGIAFSILLGGILAWFFSRRNYRPVNDLIHDIEKKFRPPSDKETDEYRFIQGAMDATFSEKDEISERLRQQNLILRSNFLVGLLKGRFVRGPYIAKALETYRLDFEEGCFAVLLFCVSGYSSLAADSGKDEAGRIEMADLLVSRIVEEIINRKNKCHLVETDRMLACIVNFMGYDTAESGRELISAAAEACSRVRDETGLEILAAASDIHETLYGLPDAYQEALSAMEYRKVMNAAEIVAYGNINVSNQGYNYPAEAERRFINSIKAGDLDAAKVCLNGIIERNFTDTVISAGMAKCLAFDLVGTVFKTISETGVLREGTFIRELDTAKRLLECDDFQQMKEAMTSMLEEICTYIQQNRKPRKDSLLDQVIEFICSRYHDPNLSVSQIADRFALTPAYLTRLFKEQSGEGLLDYITQVRMEKAKQLLHKQGVNIKDVAAKVGYYSSTAFIRTFKKLEGVTPGSFKEIG